MKALVYHGPNQMSWEDFPDPQPGPGEVLVAVRAVGICGSDLHGYTGATGRRIPPMVMGHEAVGEVVALGSGVAERCLGTRAVLRPNIMCGQCPQCRSGRDNLCENRAMIGVHRQGAMAERVVVPVENLCPLPDDIEDAAGTLVEPLAVGVRAARQAGDLGGKTVLVNGCGPIGLFTMLAAKRCGASRVAMTDVIQGRRQVALAMGADLVLDPRHGDWQTHLQEFSGGKGVQVAFDAVGIPVTFEQALFSLGLSGTLVALGGWQTVNLDLRRLVGREIQLVGTLNYTPEEFATAHHWLLQGIFDPALLITDIHPLAEGAQIFASLAQSQGDSIKVVLTAGDSKMEVG